MGPWQRCVRTALVLAGLWGGQVHAGSETDAGRAVYNYRCYFCHGYSGDAQTLASTYLSPRPADFTRLSPDERSRAGMIRSVTEGHPGTAMKGFAGVIDAREIEQVVDFVRDEFMRRKAVNTRYHTVENGWSDHERYRAAFPFATGDLPLDGAWSSLSPEAQAGKRLFLTACVSCHDRARVMSEGPDWEGRPLSYPRNRHQPGVQPPPSRLDAITSASPYLLHDVIPQIEGLSRLEQTGEHLYQKNCAFCHAADGTGKNWIGSFMQPHPRDLTDARFMNAMTRARLKHTIREGLPDTSMPAWGGVLDEAQIDAIVAYVSRAFHSLD